MGTQITRTALRSFGKAEYLGTSIRTHMAEVSTKLDAAFSVLPPKGEGEPPRPDWTQVQGTHLELLDHVAEEAQQGGLAFRAAKVRVFQLVRHRDGVITSLGRRHRSLRKSFEGAYTPSSLPLVGLDEPPVRPILGVREQYRDAIARMRDPELPEKLGEPVAGQEPLDFEKLANGMEEELRAYEKVLDDLTEARKLRDEAFIARKAAEERLESTYVNVARVQEGYFRLAGLEDLADRIRLTIPRSSRAPEPAPETGPEGETEPAPDAGPEGEAEPSQP